MTRSRVRLLSIVATILGLAACDDDSARGTRDTSKSLGDGEIPGATGDGDGDGDGDAVADSGGELSDESSASASPSGGDGDGDDDDDGTAPQAGLLTAGAWDDNRNYEHFTAFRRDLEKQKLPGLLELTTAEYDAAHEKFAGDRDPNDTLDVALVIDTTGSMGDEITYLQSEFLALTKTIEAKYPDSEQRWALIVYRDEGDEYVVRWFDFRDNAVELRDKLAEQSASGGGDFPEAPDAALAIMNQLTWRNSDATARLAFWVADAPHHDDKRSEMTAALREAADLDVHIYPVASSGIDALMEFTMRSAAQSTGGRYLFLTDDSGVGGSHLEPSIPCYFVTRLDDAVLRMVDIELSGTYREPTTESILRTGGDPQDGACELESGATVEAF